MMVSKMRQIPHTFQGSIQLYVNIVRKLLSLYCTVLFFFFCCQTGENNDFPARTMRWRMLREDRLGWLMAPWDETWCSLGTNLFPWLRPRTAEVTRTYSASHQKPLRLNPSQQRRKTDVGNISLGNKKSRLDSGDVMLPQICKNTHTDTKCSWFSAYIMHFPSAW